jgi:putative DNA primase/helicase
MEVTGKDFATIAREIDTDFGNVSDYKPVPKTKTSKLERAITIFNESSRLLDTPGQTYLNNRGIYTMPRGFLRYGTLKEGSAMIAIATNEFKESKMLHATYLENGYKRQGIARKMYTLVESNEPLSIKLFPCNDVLGISEGIETALSAHQLYKLPVWSTMNSGFLEKFKAPTGIKTLYIFADNDANGTGLAAAFVCGKKNILYGNDVETVIIRWPKVVNDFNDLITDGDGVVEWKLTKG